MDTEIRVAAIGPEEPSPVSRQISRVLLMSPPVVLSVGDKNPNDENILHLGLAYLAAALRENGYEVRILDCFAESMFHQRNSTSDGWLELGLSDEEIIKRIGEFSPDLIGMTIPFSCRHYAAHRLAKEIKSAYPYTPIVAGGNHVTAIPEKIDPGLFDYLVIGEGEDTLVNLIDAMNSGQGAESTPGVYGSTKPRAPYVDDLDGLPYPAIDLMPLSKLWSSGRRWINMVATRGCVYNCSFCAVHTVMGWKPRRRSVENVIREIRHWNSLYGIQQIYFEDDNLTYDTAWAKELFARIAENRFGIRFHARNGIRADSIDLEMLKLMKAAGFHDFMISPESGSQVTVDKIIGKRMRLTDCEKAIELAKEVGLGINAFFVMGLPDETMADLEQTVRYARHLKDMGVAGFWLSTASPYPGTRLYQECIQKGYIDPDNLDYRRLRTTDYAINHPAFSLTELKAFREQAMAELAPSRHSLTRRVVNGLSLLVSDPSFFLAKLKYQSRVWVSILLSPWLLPGVSCKQVPLLASREVPHSGAESPNIPERLGY